MSAPDAPNGGGGDEPRVRDLIERGEPAAPEPDLETLARLAAWFELPSFDQLIESGTPAGAPSRAEQIQRQRAQALAEIDPALVDRLHRPLAIADELARVVPGPVTAERRVLAIDEAAIPTPPTDEDYREVEIPGPLRRDLSTCTPQAFLRDLHRPEKEFYVQLESPWQDDGDDDPPPADPMAPVRDTLRVDYRVGTTVPSAITAMAASWSDLRARLAAPWAEAKRERARQREAELLAAEEGKDGAAAAVSRGPEGAP